MALIGTAGERPAAAFKASTQKNVYRGQRDGACVVKIFFAWAAATENAVKQLIPILEPRTPGGRISSLDCE